MALILLEGVWQNRLATFYVHENLNIRDEMRGSLGCSENCIFHDRNYPEFFSIPLYIIKRGKLKKKMKKLDFSLGGGPSKNLRSSFGSKIRIQRK